jgi:hypothetical protein
MITIMTGEKADVSTVRERVDTEEAGSPEGVSELQAAEVGHPRLGNTSHKKGERGN